MSAASATSPMSLSPLVVIALVAGAGAGYAGAHLAVASSARADESRSVDAAELEVLRLEVAELQSQLATRPESSKLLMPAASSTDARIPVGEIDAAVARWMERNAAERLGALDADTALELDAAPELRDTQSLVDELLAAGPWGDANDALWEELRERGLIDEAIALFEARAAARPNDPDARVELAAAYLAKIQDVPQGPQSGLWAMKADGAYDAALELDERHWNARFGKATSLSFWPPLFGKQGEAIQNFEVLLAQQKSDPPSDGHAMTYLFLGNLYQQTGESAKAVALWKEGAALFPSNSDLADKVGAFGQD